jgi:hypothetical protein
MLGSRGIYGTWPHGSKTWRKLTEKAGFIDIQVCWYETPVGKWGGRDGIDMRENLVGLMSATKSAAAANAGFGVISGGSEGYDRWMKDVVREVDERATEPKVRWVMICARKPALGDRRSI